MANLPSNRTNLQAAIGNQIAGTTADAAANIKSIIEAYDTIDMLNQKVDALVSAGILSPIPPVSLYRQALINGNFDIWQRGTSFNAAGYTADRWYCDAVNAAISQQLNGVPIGSSKVARVTVNATNGYSNLYQAMEKERCVKLWGKRVTFSVKLRRSSSFNSAIQILIQKNATADTMLGGSWSNIIGVTVPVSSLPSGASSSDWYTAQVTADIPADGSANGIRVMINQIATSSPIGSYYEVAQAQVNVGDTVYPFQPKSFEDELRECMRYFEKSYNYDDPPKTTTTAGIIFCQVPSNTVAVAQEYGTVFFKQRKRATPNITIYPYSTPANTGRVSQENGTDLASGSGAIRFVGESSFTPYNGTGGTLTTNLNGVVFHYAADAEL